MRVAAYLVPLLCAASGLARPQTLPPLDLGYRQMYNLQFGNAHHTFQNWIESHPADPLGPVSDAAAYLFAEFDRLHILQSELFTDDNDFRLRKRPQADPQVKLAFQTDVERADRLADQILAREPGDDNALFAKILGDGLCADYTALIEKRYAASFAYMKAGRVLAQSLLARNPSYYDAYLAVGIENYMLGVTSAPVRWVLRLAGAQTSKSQGVDNLRLTAEKGHFLLPYARLMLAVAALRDKDAATASKLLEGLTHDFPQNQLYANELSRLKSRRLQSP